MPPAIRVLPFLTLLLCGSVALTPVWLQGDDAKKKGGPVASKEKLAEMIENLGYEKDATIKGDDGVYRFSLPIEGWSFHATISLSSDGSQLWLTAGLQSIPDTANPRGDIMLRLLAENERDNIFFSANARSGMLRLNMAIANRDITPASLRQNLEAFKRRIGQTEDLWNPKKWK